MHKPLGLAICLAGWLGCSSAAQSPDVAAPQGGDPSGGDPSGGGGGGGDGGGGPLTGEDRTLPFEVLGVDRTSADLRFVVPADVLAGRTKTSLKLSIHNIRYAGEATVSVNSGPAIPLEGGFVRGWGGTAARLVEVPSGQLKGGDNTLTFSFLKAQDSVTGYRVLTVAIVTEGTHPATFVPALGHTDPTKWSAPDAAKAAAGEKLFNLRKTDNAGKVAAACSDCHAMTGADLQYFSYTNKSIRVRSIFHGFTAEEGDAIASYVRVKNAAVPPEGTPYDPPFQPGPGNKPGTSSGAGLAAVLGSDAEFRDKVFGGAVNATHTIEWAGATDPFLTPVSFQLPDWHSWLPRTFDVRVTDFFKLQNQPDKWVDFFAAPSIQKFRNIEEAYHGFTEKATLAMHPASGSPPANPDPLTAFYGTLSVEDETNIWRFISVRAWDWMRGNKFAGPTHGAPIKGYIQMAAPWVVGGVYRSNANFNRTGKTDANIALQQAAQWFWLSFVINPGQSQAQMNEPNDYSYFSPQMNTMPFDSPDGAAHQSAYVYLRGSYEWHTSPNTKGQRLGIRFGNLPAGAVVPPNVNRKDALRLTGDETVQLMMREMELDKASFAAGEPMGNGYFDGWNSGSWGYVYNTLSAAQRDKLNIFLNEAFANGVGPAYAAGWTAKDPLRVLLPLQCKTTADCPSRFNGCDAAASFGRGICLP